jgi:hypothetical protein
MRKQAQGQTNQECHMKLNPDPARKSCEAAAGGAVPIAQPANKPGPPAKADVSEHFRRLSSDEVVSPGDFVKDGHHGFEPWEGPGGFRADAFLKPIYRRQKAG